MKRFVALLLACVMMFALCGYANAAEAYDVSNDERFDNPNIFYATKFSEAYKYNKVNAKDEYIGNVFSARTYIHEIEEEFIIAYVIPDDRNIEYPQVSFKIPLAREFIKTLAVNQVLDVYGEIASIEEATDDKGKVVVLISFNEKNKVKDAINLYESVENLKKSWENGTQIQFQKISGRTIFNYNYRDKAGIEKILNLKESGSVRISAKVFYSLAGYVGPFQVFFDIDSIYEMK